MTPHPSQEAVATAVAALEATYRRLAWYVRQLHLNPRPLPEWVGDIEELEP